MLGDARSGAINAADLGTLAFCFLLCVFMNITPYKPTVGR